MQNLAALLMQMERLESEVSSRLLGLQGKLVQGESREGLVVATGDVWFNLKGLHINREILATKTHDLTALESAVVEAVNNATREARKVLRAEIGGAICGQVPREFAGFFGKSEAER